MFIISHKEGDSGNILSLSTNPNVTVSPHLVINYDVYMWLNYYIVFAFVLTISFLSIEHD